MTSKTSTQQRLLIIGAGDVAFRALPWLKKRFRVVALCRTSEQASRWRENGAIPILGDLDQRQSIKRLLGLAPYVLYSAPPNPTISGDLRLKHCLGRLNEAGIIPCRVVYISTSGVYGDCQGRLIDETSPVNAESPRAKRRIVAEDTLRAWVRRGLFRGSRSAVILRAPGIYALDRLPLERIRSGQVAISEAEDSFTNHIHADDLARVACLALFRGGNARVYNVSDDSQIKMGDWFDLVARSFKLPEVKRVSREHAERSLPSQLWSFMRESRRLQNRRMKNELGVRLRFPSVHAGLESLLRP